MGAVKQTADCQGEIMVELREPRGRRMLRYLLVGAALLIAVWLARWLSKISDANAVVQCRALYGRAATATDTAAVDRERPFLGRRDAVEGLECGDLRSRGRL
jgi:hypothetical protein